MEEQNVARDGTYVEVNNMGKGSGEVDEMAEIAGKEASETARSAVSNLYFNLLFKQITNN